MTTIYTVIIDNRDAGTYEATAFYMREGALRFLYEAIDDLLSEVIGASSSILLNGDGTASATVEAPDALYILSLQATALY